MNRNKRMKMLVASMLCVVMACSMLMGMPELFVSAKTVVGGGASAPQTYGDWYDVVPENGNFEAGVVGMDVYGWSLTAMTNGLTVEEEDATIESYLKAYKLLTAETAEGNRVAALTKEGAGYVAMTSEAFEVEGGTPYRISYDYCIEKIINKRSTLTNVDFQGISVLVKEVNADEVVTWTKLDDNSNGRALIATSDYNEFTENEATYHKYESTSWNTITKEFRPLSDTIYAQLYIRVGAKANVTGTVLFDNVLVNEYEMYDVPNGDFSSTTHEAEGGRTAWSVETTGEVTEPSGPAGWTSVSTNNSGNTLNTNNYQNNYVATVTYETDGNAVMQYTYKTEAEASGYAWILSPSVAITAGENVSASYKYKIAGKMILKAKTAIFFYDSEGNYLSFARVASQITGPVENWQDGTTGEQVAPATAAYARVGFFAGRSKTPTASDDYPIYDGTTYYDEFALYFDDVELTGSNETSFWTAESCQDNGVPYATDVTAYYDIQQLTDDTTGHQNAWQLSVTELGGNNGVAFYSEPIEINPAQEYTTTFDYKIEGIDDTNGSKLKKIMYLVRYIDSDGNEINADAPTLVFAYRLSGFSGNYESANTNGWVSDMAVIKNIPENAVALQIGLTMVINGSVEYDIVKNLRYSWDNIRLMTTDEYNSALMSNVNSTDLLFLMLQGGNANDDELGAVDVCDLVRMKTYFVDSENTAVGEGADMNKNEIVNEDDFTLLKWKLLGVKTTSEAESVR